MNVDSQKVIAKTRMITLEISELKDLLAFLRLQRWNRNLFWLVALLCFITVPRVFAQTYLQDVSLPPVDATVPVEMGSVDLVTGALNLQIPLGTYPQRGEGTGSVALTYTSNLQYYANSCGFGCYYWSSGTASTLGEFTSSWGLATPSDTSYSLGQSSSPDISTGGGCGWWVDGTYVTEPSYYVESNFSWIAPDGSSHSWTGVDYYYAYDPINCPYTSNGGSAYDDQSTGYYLTFASGNMAIYGPDGTLYGSPKVDPNGNEYSSSDTLNRQLPQETWNPTQTTRTLLLPNAEGGTSTYTIKYQTINISTDFNYTYAGNSYTEYSGTVNEVSEIDLPDGTNYLFTYDSGTSPGHYGEMTSMKLPTGGTISYKYTNATDWGGIVLNRWLTNRYTPDSTTGWSYSTPVGSPDDCGSECSTEAFTVTAPNGDHSVHTFGLVLDMFPIETQYYDSSSNLLGTTWACYATSIMFPSYGGNTSCPSSQQGGYYKIADIATLPVPGGSATTMKEYTYDSYENVIKLQEWKFGSSLSGSPDRTTTTTYYNNGYILDKPATITVTNSSGGLVAKTVNTYDGSSLVTSGATSIVNHDDTDYGSGFTARGNLTNVQQYTSGSSSISRSMTYDITGQLRTLTDGNGNQATYSYTDKFFNDAGDSSSLSAYSPAQATNAYLTSETRGSETTTFGYYFGTGQMAEATDPNSQTAYSHYYDLLNRPTSTKYPDLGWTYLVYPSGSENQVDKYTGIGSSSLTTNCPASGNACRHDQTIRDSLGRTTSQVLLSDPSGADTTTTAYDLNGRVLKVSNPYRSTADPTYGWTTPTYDGLNRVTQTQDPDDSVAYTFYGATISSNGGRSSQMCSGYGVGVPSLSKDESGRLRQSWVDGFGRLIEVDEPDPSSGSLTSGSPLYTCYAYDLNNNLTGVSQSGSRNRSFTYDMASRLVCSANPEISIATCPSSPGSYTSGTIAYSYDGNGNVISKQAPLENQTSASNTVTTSYSYDQLNRLQSKSYLNAPAGSLSNCYQYDAATNGVGRLASEWTQAGTCSGSPPSGSATARYIDAYDPMGRIVGEQQCVMGFCTSSTPPSPSANCTSLSAADGLGYCYDLAGDLLAYSNGLNSVGNLLQWMLFSQQFDSAGRLSSSVCSNGSCGQNFPLFNATQTESYTPSNALQNWWLGTNLLVNKSYDARLRPSSETAVNP